MYNIKVKKAPIYKKTYTHVITTSCSCIYQTMDYSKYEWIPYNATRLLWGEMYIIFFLKVGTIVKWHGFLQEGQDIKDPEYVMNKNQVPGLKCTCKVDKKGGRPRGMTVHGSVFEISDSGPEEILVSGTRLNYQAVHRSTYSAEKVCDLNSFALCHWSKICITQSCQNKVKCLSDPRMLCRSQCVFSSQGLTCLWSSGFVYWGHNIRDGWMDRDWNTPWHYTPKHILPLLLSMRWDFLGPTEAQNTMNPFRFSKGMTFYFLTTYHSFFWSPL